MRTNLRKIGNSAGAIIPAVLLKELDIAEGDPIDIANDGDRIIISPVKTRPHYTLDELLAQCDENASPSEVLQEWDKSPAVGNEVW